jgi:hypothetical protein
LGLRTKRGPGVAGPNCDYSPRAARVLTQDASPQRERKPFTTAGIGLFVVD